MEGSGSGRLVPRGLRVRGVAGLGSVKGVGAGARGARRLRSVPLSGPRSRHRAMRANFGVSWTPKFTGIPSPGRNGQGSAGLGVASAPRSTERAQPAAAPRRSATFGVARTPRSTEVGDAPGSRPIPASFPPDTGANGAAIRRRRAGTPPPPSPPQPRYAPPHPRESTDPRARTKPWTRRRRVRVAAAERPAVAGLARGHAPSWIRTSGLLLRRESLYPTELSGRAAHSVLLPGCSASTRRAGWTGASPRALAPRGWQESGARSRRSQHGQLRAPRPGRGGARRGAPSGRRTGGDAHVDQARWRE